MKIRKAEGVKATVIVTVGNDGQNSTTVLYRGGKTGLAFRSSAHRILQEAGRARRAAHATLSGAFASAAIPSQQGGSQ